MSTILWFATLGILVAAGVWAIKWARNYAENPLQRGNQTIDELRAAHDRGELTAEEFAKVKRGVAEYWRSRGAIA